MESIKEGKIYLRQEFAKGTECPCCGQFVKLYKRKLGSVMGRAIIRLYNLGEGYHHVKEIIKGISATGTNDFSKLKYWQLIKEMPNLEDLDKKNCGYWKITQKGIEFVKQNIDVPSHVHIYNGKVLGFEDTTTNIIASLGNKFSYKELMNNN